MKSMKITSVLFLLIFSISIKSNAQNTITTVKMHKVVMQLNSADTSAWSGVIGNIRNFQKIWPEQVQIEVVVHGKAIDFLLKEKSHLKEDILKLTSDKIQFVACENTMRKHNITKEMLIEKVGTVPSGVAELILKQEENWGYLKTGF